MAALVLVAITLLIVVIFYFNLRKRFDDLELKLIMLESKYSKLLKLTGSDEEELPVRQICPGVSLKQEASLDRDVRCDDRIERPRALPEYLRRVERRIMENWTGILGSVILVLGVGFLGVYASIRLSEFHRFLMVVALATVLWGAFAYLYKRERWLQFALWLRSISGAVFLFAFLGAGSIQGLNWVNDPIQATALLGLGILINLYLAVVGGRQPFASLHVLLSLVALSVAPQNNIVFVVSTIVALIGIGLTYRERWDYHLLLTLSSYAVYNLYWWYQAGRNFISDKGNLLGVVAVTAVFAAVFFVHYRKTYAAKRFDRLPFFIHILNWLFYGAGLTMYSVFFRWSTILILSGSAASFLLACHAKRLGIRWLYVTDTLIAQLVMFIGIISFGRWGLNRSLLAAIIFWESLLFAEVMMREDEIGLFRIATALSHISAFVFLGIAVKTGDFGDIMSCINRGVLFLACAAAALLFHRTLHLNGNPRYMELDSLLSVEWTKGEELSFTGLLPGIFLVFAGVFAGDVLWLHYIMAASICGLIMLRDRLAANGFVLGSLAAVTGIHLVSFSGFFMPGYSSGMILLRALPLYCLSLLTAARSYIPHLKRHCGWMGIYLAVATTAILPYVILDSVSHLIPGVSWLMISLIVLEISLYIGNRFENGTKSIGEPDRYLLHTGCALILLFLVYHIMVYLQVETYIWRFKVRALIELLALAAFAWWGAQRRPKSSSEYRSYIFLHPLFAELILLFGILAVAVEFPKYWHPVVWMLVAFGLMATGKRKGSALSRVLFYSALFYLASVFQVAFLMRIYAKLGIHWFETAWFLGTVAFLLQAVFLVLFLRRAELDGITLPPALGIIYPAVKAFDRFKNAILFYPLLVGIALFILCNFDSSLITLLWAIECFAVFVISIILRESHFRYVAVAGLVLSVIRLVVYDLSQATTLIKALVFLGVGVIMLIVHALYVRYKGVAFNDKD